MFKFYILFVITMKIEDFLSNDAFTMVNKKLAKTIWIWQAIYLQELISQRKRFWGEEFYFTQNNMEDELWISTKTQQRYAKELKERWLIDFEKKWIPARNYFTTIDNAILNLLPNGKTSSVKMSELEQSNWPDYSNNNKENNNYSDWKFVPKQKTNTKQKISELDKIKNSDDVRDILSDDEIQQYKIQLKIILKMVELWYKINKSKEDIEKEFERLKSKAKLYWLIQWDGNIAWNTFYQKIDKRFDWHIENWKPVKNFKTSIVPFISK